jgi:hypothetical protein
VSERTELFQILKVPAGARIRDEPMGTKEKFWCEYEDGARYLFKFSRPDTGEHWSEKLAAELAA